MRSLPFAAYDFFAYLIPGAVCLFFFDYAFTGQRLFGHIVAGQSVAIVWIIGAVLLSYLLGQIIAGPSNFLTSYYSEQMCRRRPIANRKPTWINAGLNPLPPVIGAAISARAKDDNIDDVNTNANSLYYYALSSYLNAGEASPSIGGHLNTAAFCQYTSIACLLSAIMLVLGTIPAIRSPQYAVNFPLLFALLAFCGFLYFRYQRAYYQYIIRLYLLYIRDDKAETAR